LHFNPYDNSPGEWITVTQRVVLNTPGQANGIIEGFLDGVLVVQKTDMDFRNSSDQHISTLIFTNFLGGSGAEPSDYDDEPINDFENIVVYRYGDHVPGIKRGRQANEPGARIPLPWLFTTGGIRADIDGDGDVDLEDFGFLQGCYGASPVSGDCLRADLNGDGYVNQADFEIFRSCLSGASVPADTNCGHSEG